MHQIDSDYNVLLKNGVPVSLFLIVYKTPGLKVFISFLY